MTEAVPVSSSSRVFTAIDRWRPTVPAAAVGWISLIAAGWKQEPSPAPLVAVALTGWALAVIWNYLRRSEGKGLTLLAIAAGAVVVWLAAFVLPRGLAFTGAGLGGLAALPFCLVQSNERPWLFRLGVLVAGFFGAVLLAILPLPWAPPVRWLLIALLVFSVFQILGTPQQVERVAGPLAAVRGFVFAAAVLAPTAWFAPGGLLLEMLRTEHAVFVLVAMLSAVACELWRPGFHPFVPVKVFEIVLLLLATAALFLAVAGEFHAHRPIFVAVAVSSFALFGAMRAPACCPRQGRLLAESALLSPWLVLPFVPKLIEG